MGYDGRWRDRDPSEAPEGVPPVIRLKAPQSGQTIIHDLVQGDVTVGNEQLDDMVLLRADGTPTYMLAVVVDDHDMGVTDVIRGDDHLTNAFRQTQLYQALGWQTPRFAHIPLIHGPDGAKLSKRHGALGAEAYRDMGFLPEALRNYLLRLGWSHGDEEIISTEQAIEWFDIADAGRSPSRFDLARLTSLNAHYIKAADIARLVDLCMERLCAEEGRLQVDQAIARERLANGMEGLRQRAKTMVELADSTDLYIKSRPLEMSEKAQSQLTEAARATLKAIHALFDGLEIWEQPALEQVVKGFAEKNGVKLGKVAQPIRAALSGSTVSPSVFEVMTVLGREESLARLQDCLSD